MLTELCQELRNWFVLKKYQGTYTIDGGTLTADFLQEGQFFRVIGSTFNDGVHMYRDYEMLNETFDGEVWALAIPKEVVELSKRIQSWKDKYMGEDSVMLSPFNSESFGGYSYTKGSNAQSVTTGNSATGWKAAFAGELNRWRKI